jgi:hypothetical protein
MFNYKGILLGTMDLVTIEKPTYYIYASITEENISKMKSMVKDNQDCSLALMVSTNKYELQNASGSTSTYHTGPYIKIIWKGVRDTLILSNLANVVLS